MEDRISCCRKWQEQGVLPGFSFLDTILLDVGELSMSDLRAIRERKTLPFKSFVR